MSYHKYSKYPMCISILIALVFTATCSLQPFSSVRIKASPKVYMPLGAKSITEAEVCKKIEDFVPKNSRLYRYYPSGAANDAPIRYLMHYPVDSFDFDINRYFGGEESINNAALSQTFNKTISVPDLQQTREVHIDVSDINDKILQRVNTGNETTIFIAPGMAPNPSYSPPEANVNFHGFSTVTFGNNAKLTVSSSSLTVDYTVIAAKMKSNGNPIPILGTISPDGKKIEFSLTDATISNMLTFQATLNLTSGSGDISLKATLEGEIKEATGITINTDIEIALPVQSVSLTFPDNFKKATIAEGSMKFSVQKPNEWSGIIIEEKMKVEQGGVGGFSIIPSEYRPLGNTISLENKNLNNQSTLSCTPAFKVKLNNATYTRQVSLPATLALDIKKFKEITLQNPSGLTDEKNEPIPNTIKDWVKKIKFNSVSATIKLNNGLPEGNPVTITLESTAFKIPSHSEEFAAEQETTKVYHGSSNWELDVEHTTSPLDLKSTVRLPGYDSDKDTFTVKNISTGSNITFSGAVSFNLDWEEITLKAKNNQTVSFPPTGRMDLSKLTSKLKDFGIKLEEIPVYFYAGSDSGLFKNKTMDVKLTATYIKTGETSDTPAVLVDKSNITLKALPAGTFPSDKTFTGSIPPATFVIKEGEDGVLTTFAGIMNDYPKDLQLACVLNMNEIPITRAEYNTLKDKKPKVSIDLVLDVPVGFKVASDHTLSLMDMLGINMSGTDLFGRRSEHDQSSEIGQILNSLRSIQICINLKNDLSGDVPKCILRFKNGSGIAINDDSGNPIEKEITAAAGEQTVKLTSSELKKLLDTYPVSPDLVLELPKGSYSLKRGFKLGASITVLAETDIDYSMQVN